MTAKSIDWEHLSRQGALLCPRYGPLPLSRRQRPQDLQSRQVFAAQSALPCAVEPGVRAVPERPLRALPARHPELLDKPMRPYRFACSTVNQRVKMVEDHYRLLLGLYPSSSTRSIWGGIVLGHYPDGGWRIVLRHDGTFRREAELALSIVNARGATLQLCLLLAGNETGAGPGDRVGAGARSPVSSSPRSRCGH